MTKANPVEFHLIKTRDAMTERADNQIDKCVFTPEFTLDTVVSEIMADFALVEIAAERTRIADELLKLWVERMSTEEFVDITLPRFADELRGEL